MDFLVRPARTISGSLQLPGDKSISHRYAMLGAMAAGETRLTNFSTGADCASTLACLRALGVHCESKDDQTVITGKDAVLSPPTAALDCRNSGSTMRMLSGILAGQPFTSQLIGDASLSRRPMARIIQPLEQMGAKFSSAEGQRPPLRITGGSLRSIDYTMPTPSAQVKSSLLFAGLLAQGETRIEEPVRTRDHGELALRAFGANLTRHGREVRIQGGQKLHNLEATIPGDISSAAFFLCAAALFPGSQLAITDLLMNPTRARMLDLLIAMGSGISITQLEEHHGELVGAVQIQGDKLKGAKISGSETASLIDEIPVLAAIAPYSSGGMEIRDARELRVKESDRIAAVAKNLRAMGAHLEEKEDGLKIPGGQQLHGAEIDSHDDHRIAMAFAIAAMRAEGDTLIHGAEAAVISFPEFFDTLERVAQR